MRLKFIVWGWAIGLSIFIYTSVFAQTESCGTHFIHEELLENNLDYESRFNLSNAQIKKKTEELWESRAYLNASKDETGGASFTIPVVVHVIHNPADSYGAGSNITDEQVFEGIEQLNQGFRNDGVYDPSTGVDTEIEFCLAQRSPDGDPTNGINRISSADYYHFDIATEEPEMKNNTDRWNPEHYMNIWVVEEICKSNLLNNPCGIVAFAYLAHEHGKDYDGVVTELQYFGLDPNDAKIAIHEVGHYLNLLHTFYQGCDNDNCLEDGDYICDTPPDAISSTLNCINPINSCTSDEDDTHIRNPFRPTFLGGIGDQPDQLENYMDYSYKACRNTFTSGQKDRMHLALLGQRASLLNSLGCLSVNEVDAGISEISAPSDHACSTFFDPVFTLTNYGTSSLTNVFINYQVDISGVEYTYNWTGILAGGESVDVQVPGYSGLSAGSHDISAYTWSPNGSIDQQTSNDELIQNFIYTSGLNAPDDQNFEGASSLNQWIASNPDNGRTWERVLISGCSTNDNRAMTMNNHGYSNGLGQSDYLFGRVDFDGLLTGFLDFDVAYAQVNPEYADRLKIVVSTDCGETYSEVYNKVGSNLATTSTFHSNSWMPSSCSDWRTESVNLSQYAGQEILIGFVNVSEAGNNIYIDNITFDGADFIPCPTPSFVGVEEVNFTSAKFTWNSSESGATYQLRIREVGTSEWIGNYENVQSPFSVWGLLAGRNYETQVQTHCTYGSSAFSPFVSFTTATSTCHPPEGITVSEIDYTVATVSWDAEEDGYQYHVSYQTEGQDPQFITTEETSVELTGLTGDAEYSLSIQKVCVIGITSYASNPIHFTTQLSCQPPGGLIVSYISNNSATLEWDFKENAVSYFLEWRELGSGANWDGAYKGEESGSISGLEEEVLYEARIRSACEGGQGAPSSTIVFQTVRPCGIPGSLDIISSTDSTAFVTWLGSPGVLGYNIKFIAEDGFLWETISSTTNTAWLYGLEPCKKYRFKVQTMCPNNNSFYSPSAEFYTNCDGYCVANSSDSFKEWISSISIGLSSNNSGNDDGYGDYKNISFDLERGSVNPFKFVAGVTRKGMRAYWDVWIDFNHNKEFDSNELVVSAGDPLFGIIYNSDPELEGTITIPENAFPGQALMRIALRFNEHADPCGIYEFGEVEDYFVNVTVAEGKQDESSPLTINNTDFTAIAGPNPMNQFLQVEWSNNHSQSPVNLKLYDIQAKCWIQQQLSSNISGQAKIQVNQLPKGFYFLELRTSEGVFKQKLYH